jgi:ABC-type glycerol-3-phosphate transport system substrate-binding protein
MFTGCGGGGAPATSGFAPVDETHAVFWDRQTTETAALMAGIVERYNGTTPPLPVKIETTGNYGEIYQKTMASIQAKRLPAMAVSYESMTAQYAASGAVASLEPHVADGARGLAPDDLEDFFETVLASCRFEEHGGALLSFPLAKSVLMLYANHRVLREAGIEKPPATWQDFLTQCRTIKEKTGKPGIALSVDCSTISAMILSTGGEVLKDGALQYDQPASIAVFELLETLTKEGLAYQIAARTFDDEAAFAANKIAFTLRTSAGSANMAMAMGGKNDDWSVNPIPQADPAKPATIVFGPNVTLFAVGTAQEEAAWGFVKYFTSPEVMTEWTLATGYVPFRKSLADDSKIKAYFEAWPSNRSAFDCLSFARTEPNVAGWQQIRKLVEQAETAVLSGLKTGREAAMALQAEAQAELERS